MTYSLSNCSVFTVYIVIYNNRTTVYELSKFFMSYLIFYYAVKDKQVHNDFRSTRIVLL